MLEVLERDLRARHYSFRTVRAYRDWVERFLNFHDGRSVADLSRDQIDVYLRYLAKGMSRSLLS